MNKDEILEKARKENNNHDLETDALKMQSRKTSRTVLLLVVIIMFFLQAFSDHLEEFVIVRLMAWALDFGESLYIAVQRKRRLDWAEAIIMLMLLFSDGAIYVKHLFW